MKLDNYLRGDGIGRLVHVHPNAMVLATSANSQNATIIRSNGQTYIQPRSSLIASIAAVSKAKQTLVPIAVADSGSEGDR